MWYNFLCDMTELPNFIYDEIMIKFFYFWILFISAYNLETLVNTLGKSLMNKTNKRGPITKPWRTPLKISTQSETISPWTTLCLLSFRKASIHLSISPSKPYALNLVSRRLCWTMSNALEKSNKITSTGMPLCKLAEMKSRVVHVMHNKSCTTNHAQKIMHCMTCNAWFEFEFEFFSHQK